MKIALNIEFLGARRGGAEKYAAALARWLRAAGHEVHVFAREVDPGELPQDVPVHWVRPWRIPGLGALRSYLFARSSQRALRNQDFDLILGFVKVWYQHAYLAVGGAQPATLAYNSRRFRSRLARSLWWLGKALNVKQWVFRLIARKQFRSDHAPHVIAPSRMVAEHFRQYHGIPPQRISVVYNALEGSGAQPSAAARDAFRRRHGLQPGDVAVLFVARNYAAKGLSPLLEAFARIAGSFPRARLIVCGSRRDGPFRRRAERLGLRDRVLFLRFVDDVQECFAGCDVFAFPTFYDPCSLVVLEAMDAGLPVITTRQNGAGELLVEGQDGFVVDSPWALDQLCQRLALLLGDDGLRRRMGEQARCHAQAFTLSARREELWAALSRAAADPLAKPSVRSAA